MQLPDETIAYNYHSLLVPPGEEWTPAAEVRARHFLPPSELRELMPRLLQVRGQIAAERELKQVPPELQPLDTGFIDLPQQYLDQYRRLGEMSTVGRIIHQAMLLRAEADRIIVLGTGGESLGGQALFHALKNPHHNDLPSESRLGVPRLYFAGDSLDNDSLADLLEMLQATCVDPELREERWAVIAVSKSGSDVESLAAFRAFRREANDFYGLHSRRRQQLTVPVAGTHSRLRDLCHAEGFADERIFTIPDNIGSPYTVFTPAGLLPAAVLDLDIRAILLGAAAMTRRFLDEPFERNPVLQYAAVNYLLTAQHQATTRVMSVWSRKLEALGRWYDHLLGDSLNKQGHGPTPLTLVQTRDLHGRSQELLEGTRDKLVNHLIVKTSNTPAILMGMEDHNEDDLNECSRKGLPDLMEAACQTFKRSQAAVARPSADLIAPSLSEHVLGQLLQMLMLATVVEGRLMGVNPFGQPALRAYQLELRANLKS